MEATATKPTNATTDGKPEFKKRYRPSKKPIDPDMPSKQPGPTTTPVERTEAHVQGLKPKTDIKANKKTQPINDPLEIPETLVLGLSGLSLRPGKLRYRVDASGYIDLVRATYDEYNALDRYFERTISPAMFEYYCVSAYWLRCYQILFDSGRDVHRTYRQLQQVFPEDFVLPAPISAWLAGMGNFTDPAQRQFELDIQEPGPGASVGGITGGFGNIGPQNVHHYACNIAPAAILYRLYAENCTNTQWIDDHYLFVYPNQLAAGHGGIPNLNLLGWAPLVRPHQDVRRQLLRLGVTSRVNAVGDDHVIIDHAPPAVRGIPHIRGLVEYIAGKLTTYKEIKLMPTVPTNKVGSSTQIGYVESAPAAVDVAYPQLSKITHQELTGYSAHQLGVKSGSAIPIMKYRINRRSTAEAPRPDVFPFSFANIPAGWHANINSYYHHGGQARWNIDDLNTSSVDGRLISEEFVHKYKV